jgi:hypothetical protein
LLLEHKDCGCSNWWFDHFKDWHNIVCAEINREALSADMKTAREWVKSAWVECKKRYTKEEFCNAEETGFFYNITSDTVFKFKGEKCVSGKKKKLFNNVDV